jgi:inositol-phosphate phosphatase/L-galactose 1-phosphate phosphatase/histidinol-phosphatase
VANLDDFTEFAEELAEAARAVLLSAYRTPIRSQDKPDASPVTEVDREAETVMRGLIGKAFPDHGIIGEEFPPVRLGAPWLWTLDPIDGTKSFLTGRPTFAILVALLHEGAPVLGVIDNPVLDERWLGARGRATTLNGQPARARGRPELAGAALCAGSPEMFEGADAESFARVRAATGRPHYGGECYAYGLLASGHVDLVVEATLGPDDYFPLVPVVEGAGGVITDWQGAPLTMESDGRVAAAGDRRIHDKALKLLRP